MREGILPPKWTLLAVVICALVMLALVELHVHSVNGPWYGVTYYRRLPALRVYGLTLLAAAPTIVAVMLWERIKRWRALLLLLPMLSAFSARLVSAAVIDPNLKLDFISYAVMSKDAVSYYVDAAALSTVPNWLREFPQIMPILSLHSQTKAPGPILYYMAFINALGHGPHTALIAGVVLGAIATLSIPACYLFLQALDADSTAAFFGACFMSLCPGFILFLPMSDPVYTILSCLLGYFWIRALKRGSVVNAIGLGLVAAAVLIVSFNVLVFGLFLVGYALVGTERPLKKSSQIAATHAAIAAATCVIVMSILFVATGYDPIATFQSAWRNQHALLTLHAGDRPYPATVWNDLLDFALGSGWISYVLVGFAIARCVRVGIRDPQTRVVLLCVGQLVIVAVTALLAAETARVWNFMLPLLMFPVGIELSRQDLRGRIIILTCLVVILAADCRNISFVL